MKITSCGYYYPILNLHRYSKHQGAEVLRVPKTIVPDVSQNSNHFVYSDEIMRMLMFTNHCNYEHEQNTNQLY